MKDENLKVDRPNVILTGDSVASKDLVENCVQLKNACQSLHATVQLRFKRRDADQASAAYATGLSAN